MTPAQATSAKQPPRPPTHAGAAVWRDGAGGPLFLLVTPRDRRDQWLLPKGHIEPGETPARTAQREVREETGLEVTVGDPLGTESFISKDKEVVCAYYLARCDTTSADVPEGEAVRLAEGRWGIWLRAAEAEQKATFPPGRATVAAARRLLGC
ncbi:MAG: NUDIX domain-containing protein [Acidobacteriota bacterium]